MAEARGGRADRLFIEEKIHLHFVKLLSDQSAKDYPWIVSTIHF